MFRVERNSIYENAGILAVHFNFFQHEFQARKKTLTGWGGSFTVITYNI